MSRLYYPKPEKRELVKGEKAAIDVAEATRKIGKLIPTELVTAYAALVAASLAIRWGSVRLPVVWFCFAACWVLTPVYLNYMADAGKPKRNQIIVGALAFPIWAYLISGAQVIPDYHDPAIGTVVALLFSVATAPIRMNR